MIVLDVATAKLEVILAGAVSANQLQVNAWYFDQYPQTQTQPRSGRNTTLTNGANDVTAVAATGLAGVRRNIHTMSIYNADTASAVVTVKVDDGTNERIVVKQTLQAGDSLTYEHGNGWSFTTATTAPFTDTLAIVKGSADPTKQVRFEVDGLTTGTVRVITVPDRDLTLNNLAPATAALGADVNLNNTANYFDGPSVNVGTVGTWFVSGTVSVQDAGGGGAVYYAKLYDGTTTINSCQSAGPSGTNGITSITLSGFITTPAGNLRIAVRDTTSTSGLMLFNASGLSKDSHITAIRVG